MKQEAASFPDRVGIIYDIDAAIVLRIVIYTLKIVPMAQPNSQPANLITGAIPLI